MLRDAVAHVLGRPPVHLFVLWSYARELEAAIVEDVRSRFDVLDEAEIAWTQGPGFAQNLSRFYGSDLPPGSEKELHCGDGPLLLLVVLDRHPRYRLRRTKRGARVLNTSVVDARQRYRDWTGGGHKVHASDSVAETRRNHALLLGLPVPDLRRPRPPHGEAPRRRLDTDLAGADGWDSLDQLWLALRTHGARGLRSSPHRVTVWAADVWEVSLVAGGTETGPGRRSVRVADELVTVVVHEDPIRPARAGLAALRARVRRARRTTH